MIEITAEFPYPTEDEISEYYKGSDAERRFRGVIDDFFGLREDRRLDDDIGGFRSEIEEKHSIKITKVPWVQFKADVLQHIRRTFPPNMFPGLVQQIKEEYGPDFPDADEFKTIDGILEYLELQTP